MSKSHKFLVLSHISELVGGAEKSMLDLFDKWVEKYDLKPEFILRTPVGTLGNELKKRGWKYHAVDYTFWSEAKPPKEVEAIKKKMIKNTNAIIEIEQIIKKTKPDLVFTNSVVCPWAAIAARNQHVPHIWFVREYGDLDHGRIFEIGRKKTWEDVDSLSNLVITNSKALAKHISQYINDQKVTTLYHPFDLKEISKRSKEKVRAPFKNKGSLKLILIAGSLTKSKGVKEAVEATGILNRRGHIAEICLVGRKDNQPYLQEIGRIIDKYKIKDKVHFVGWQKNPLAYVSQSDVGIMASCMEAFGRVTFEYLAIGKPVLGTNSGGTPEMVIDGKNGFLYEWGDVGSLEEGLKRYAEDRQLLIEHSKNAERQAKEMLKSQYNEGNLFKQVKQAAGKQPLAKKIHYDKNLSEHYELIKKELGKRRVLRNIKQKARTKVGSSYRVARSSARRIIKGY